MILLHSIPRDVRVKGYQCSFFNCKGSGRVWVILPITSQLGRNSQARGIINNSWLVIIGKGVGPM